jgi:hypothetical protein
MKKETKRSSNQETKLVMQLTPRTTRHHSHQSNSQVLDTRRYSGDQKKASGKTSSKRSLFLQPSSTRNLRRFSTANKRRVRIRTVEPGLERFCWYRINVSLLLNFLLCVISNKLETRNSFTSIFNNNTQKSFFNNNNSNHGPHQASKCVQGHIPTQLLLSNLTLLSSNCFIVDCTQVHRRKGSP